MASNSNDRAYDNFTPKHEMSRESATHTLSVDLSNEGYKKEHIRVQILHSQRRLIVRGERPAGGDRWRRFRLELRVPDGCDAKAIHARFENGVVRVTMPGVAPEPVQVETGAAAKQDPSPATPKPASPPSSAQDQKDGGGRAAPAGEGEGDKQKDEVAAQKQEAMRQRVSSAKDGGRDDDGTGAGGGGVGSRQGYGFLPAGRTMVVTTVISVVFVLITLGIYVKYSLSP
ncbi:hypothetical protein BS78_01G226500 [Paspalum vaginatum]|nr:hypothetical protein BS78_01G226500 [Paspalum vaginatum]